VSAQAVLRSFRAMPREPRCNTSKCLFLRGKTVFSGLAAGRERLCPFPDKPCVPRREKYRRAPRQLRFVSRLQDRAPGFARRQGWYGHCRRHGMNAAANALHILQTSPHFEMLGGQAAVERLVDAFYRHMDTRPDARGIRAMHEPDLASTKAVLVLYLCEWLGGPKDYSARRGHPRLRMRHAGFAIGVAERDAWLACMSAALDDVDATPALRSELMAAFFKTADWMRNRTEASTSSSPVSQLRTELKICPAKS